MKNKKTLSDLSSKKLSHNILKTAITIVRDYDLKVREARRGDFPELADEILAVQLGIRESFAKLFSSEDPDFNRIGFIEDCIFYDE